MQAHFVGFCSFYGFTCCSYYHDFASTSNCTTFDLRFGFSCYQLGYDFKGTGNNFRGTTVYSFEGNFHFTGLCGSYSKDGFYSDGNLRHRHQHPTCLV
jgi:hypothetical protein